MTATRIITIADMEFEIPQPYVPGHALTEGEAKAMNQLLAENIRNNTAAKVKAAKEGAPKKEGDPTLETIAAYVSEYAAGYEFTIATPGTARVTDPLELKCMQLARETLKSALKAKGISYTAVPAEKRDELLALIAATESVVKAARKMLEEERKRAEGALAGISLDGLGV